MSHLNCHTFDFINADESERASQVSLRSPRDSIGLAHWLLDLWPTAHEFRSANEQRRPHKLSWVVFLFRGEGGGLAWNFAVGLLHADVGN